MSWRELAVQVPAHAVERLSGLLFARGASGVQEDWLPGQAPPPPQPWDTGPAVPEPSDRIVRAWFEDPDAGAIAREVRELVGADASWSTVSEVDWEATSRASFTPIHVSERLVVAPPWDAPPGAVIVVPGQGFGTGHHTTTQQALKALDRLADGATSALDVGCGSGVLALAAARLGLRAEGVDIDAASVAEARENARLNGIDAVFSTTPVEDLREPADVVLANLFAEVLVKVAPHLVRLARRHIVLAGILADREPAVRAAFEGEPTERDQDGEWVCLVYRA